MRTRLPLLLLAAALLPPATARPARGDFSSGATARLSRTTARPFEFLTIATTGLDTGEETVVHFRSATLDIPVAPTVVAEDFIRVAVPVLVKKAKFSGGAVEVHVAQPGVGEEAECFAGRLKIARLPKSRLPAGTLTGVYLEVQRELLLERREALPGSGLAGDSPANLQAIDDAVAAMDVLLDATDGSAGPSAKGPPADFDVALTNATLRETDGLILGMLQAGAVNTDSPPLQLTLDNLFAEASAPRTLTPTARLQLATTLKDAVRNAQVDDIVRMHQASTAPLTAMAGASAMLAAALAITPGAQGAALLAATGAAWLSLASDIITLGQMAVLYQEANWYTDQRHATAYRTYMDAIVRLRDDLILGKVVGGAFKAAGLLFRARNLLDFADGLREFAGGVSQHAAGLEGHPGVSRLAAGFPAKLPKGLYEFNIGGQVFTLPFSKGFDVNQFASLLESSVQASCQCIPSTGIPVVQVNSTPFDGSGFTITATCTCTFPDGQVATDTQTIRISRLL